MQISASGHSLDCLRHANSDGIAQGLRRASLIPGGIGPALDGPNGLIPDYPSSLLARGKIACVPFIAGANLDEGESEVTLFLLGMELYLLLSTPQELFLPFRASIQRRIFVI